MNAKILYLILVKFDFLSLQMLWLILLLLQLCNLKYIVFYLNLFIDKIIKLLDTITKLYLPNILPVDGS